MPQNTSASPEEQKRLKMREYGRAYDSRNREKRAAANKIWRKKNAAYIKAKRKAWRASRPNYYKEHYAKNAEKFRARARKFNKDHPEKIRAAYVRWRDKDLDKFHAIRRKAAKKWYHANPKKAAEMRDRWIAENYEYYLAEARTRSLKWAKDNPDAAKAKFHRRRARKLSVGGSWTAEEWQRLKKRYAYKCLACHRSEKLLVSLGLTLTPDHVLPLNKLGSNDISNIQPLCHGRGGCNNKKYIKHVDYRKNAGK